MPAVTQIEGDLFNAEEVRLLPQCHGSIKSSQVKGSILLHSCNCQGSWGSGIALALKKRFPASFEQYADYCSERSDDELIGTTYVTDEEDSYRIACLFTSARYGRGKAKPAEILKATKSAIDDLVAQIKGDPALSKKRKSLCAVKLNAGAFAVPWEETKALLEERFSSHGMNLTVYDK